MVLVGFCVLTVSQNQRFCWFSSFWLISVQLSDTGLKGFLKINATTGPLQQATISAAYAR